MLMPLKWCGSAVPKGIITSLHLRSSSFDWPLCCNLICRMRVSLTKCPVGSPPTLKLLLLMENLQPVLQKRVKKILTQILSPLRPAELLGSLLGSPAISQHLQGPQTCLSIVHEEKASKEAKNHKVASCSRKTCVRICEK